MIILRYGIHTYNPIAIQHTVQRLRSPATTTLSSFSIFFHLSVFTIDHREPDRFFIVDFISYT